MGIEREKAKIEGDINALDERFKEEQEKLAEVAEAKRFEEERLEGECLEAVMKLFEAEESKFLIKNLMSEMLDVTAQKEVVPVASLADENQKNTEESVPSSENSASKNLIERVGAFILSCWEVVIDYILSVMSPKNDLDNASTMTM